MRVPPLWNENLPLMVERYGLLFANNTMVMGKVFERHPRLRFGIVECGPVGEAGDSLP